MSLTYGTNGRANEEMKKSTFKSTVENWDRSKSKLTAYTFRVS